MIRLAQGATRRVNKAGQNRKKAPLPLFSVPLKNLGNIILFSGAAKEKTSFPFKPYKSPPFLLGRTIKPGSGGGGTLTPISQTPTPFFLSFFPSLAKMHFLLRLYLRPKNRRGKKKSLCKGEKKGEGGVATASLSARKCF